MNFILEKFTSSDAYLIALIAVLSVLLIINLINMIKISILTKKYNKFIRSFNGVDFEGSLTKFVEKVEKANLKYMELENHCAMIDKTLQTCVQKIGTIRYNAFEDVGSDLSFAIALLDANDNGIVINGIYSRDSSATYAKPIVNGKSKYTLSAEEMQAIDAAKKASLQGIL